MGIFYANPRLNPGLHKNKLLKEAFYRASPRQFGFDEGGGRGFGRGRAGGRCPGRVWVIYFYANLRLNLEFA